MAEITCLIESRFLKHCLSESTHKIYHRVIKCNYFGFTFANKAKFLTLPYPTVDWKSKTFHNYSLYCEINDELFLKSNPFDIPHSFHNGSPKVRDSNNFFTECAQALIFLFLFDSNDSTFFHALFHPAVNPPHAG